MATLVTCYDHWVLKSFANTDYKFFIAIIEQKNFLFLDKLYHQKHYISEECRCKHELQILIECALQTLLPHDRHFSLDVGILSFSLSLSKLFSCILHLFLLHLHSYQFRVFGTGSETSGPIPRNIFIFNWTIDVKQCNFCLPTWGNAKALARFHPKFYDENFKISSLCFKHIYPGNVKHVRESHKTHLQDFARVV